MSQRSPTTQRCAAIVTGVLVALAAAMVGMAWWGLTHPSSTPRPLPGDAVTLDSVMGQQLLGEGDSADFTGLMAAWEPQQTMTGSAVASSVIVLRAKGRALSQDAFFTPAVTAVRSWPRVLIGGVTMDEVAAMLRAHGAVVEAHHASGSSLEDFRWEVRRNLGDPNDWLIVDYHRAALGEDGIPAHTSVLGAWNDQADRVLLLDTAAHEYPPHWVSLERLFDGMTRIDPRSGRTRGWLVVR